MTYTGNDLKQHMETMGLDKTELACVLSLEISMIKEVFVENSIFGLYAIPSQMDALLKYKKIMDLKGIADDDLKWLNKNFEKLPESEKGPFYTWIKKLKLSD